MFVVISPAKKLDFESEAPVQDFTQLRYPDLSKQLINRLRELKANDISKLMKLSDALTQLNMERYQNYSEKFDSSNSKQAIFAFNGDTYVGLDAHNLSRKAINYSQKHLGILSGLYGLIRPLDLIQPYRLEMGTRLKCGPHKNLYEFWSPTITEKINEILDKEKTLINLSSNEYFSVVNVKELNGKVITPVFKEKKGDTYKVVGFCAKKARGMMSRFIMENKIENPEQLKEFTEGNYTFQAAQSDSAQWVFTRD